MFDQILLLSEGRMMYYGPACEAVSYFSSLARHSATCPPSFNPSDFFMDLVSMDYRSEKKAKDSALLIDSFAEQWDTHQLEKEKQPELGNGEKVKIQMKEEKKDETDNGAEVPQGSEVDEALPPTSSNITSALAAMDDISSSTDISAYQACWACMKKNWQSFGLLFWRSFIESKRDVVTIKIRMTVGLVFALVLGGLYNNFGHDQASIFDRTGFFFFTSINQGFPAVTAAINILVKEKVLINREVSGGSYSFFTYFIAKFLSEIPFTLAPTVVFALVIYWIVDLRAGGFPIFLMIFMLESVTAMALGLMVSAACPSVEATGAVSAPIITLLIIFSGFYM
jgi:hypothetical protein